MERYAITIGTVPQAIKARDILRKNGFKVSVKKANSELNNYGCVYAVILEGNNINEAKKLLIKSGISIKAIKGA
jgi:hypothetical protein